MNKLNLMICPHDTAKNPERWFRLVQYLNQHLDFTIHFNISLDFRDFHDCLLEADLVYANPSDGVHLVKEHQFIPIVRSTNLFDEVVFIANPNLDNPSLQSYQDSQVVTISSMVASKIATSILQKQSIVPIELVNKESWLGVINAVAKDEVPLGFVYKDTYDELSPITKQMISVIATSTEQKAFHALYINPNVSDHAPAISDTLRQMHLDPKGQEVLKDINVEAWEAMSADALQLLYEIAG
jgi:hypothetical protein